MGKVSPRVPITGGNHKGSAEWRRILLTNIAEIVLKVAAIVLACAAATVSAPSSNYVSKFRRDCFNVAAIVLAKVAKTLLASVAKIAAVSPQSRQRASPVSPQGCVNCTHWHRPRIHTQ